jgi:hypothetical protein
MKMRGFVFRFTNSKSWKSLEAWDCNCSSFPFTLSLSLCHYHSLLPVKLECTRKKLMTKQTLWTTQWNIIRIRDQQSSYSEIRIALRIIQHRVYKSITNSWFIRQPSPLSIHDRGPFTNKLKTASQNRYFIFHSPPGSVQPFWLLNSALAPYDRKLSPACTELEKSQSQQSLAKSHGRSY